MSGARESQKSPSHMFVSLHKARFIRGGLPNKPIESHAGYAQRGGASAIEASRVSHWQEVWAPGSFHRWRGGHGSLARWLQGQHCPVERKSGRIPSVACSTAKLESQSSQSPQWAAVPRMSVSRWSLYPRVQTCGLEHSGLLLRAFPLHPFPVLT